MATQSHKIYSRAYSTSSAGGLISGKGQSNSPLSYDQLRVEFDNHIRLYSRKPTALVSASDRIVDTVKRAFEKYNDGDDPAEIWIAFIKVPAKTHISLTHRAEDLARKYGHDEPGRFKYEVVFEWQIPEYCLLHEVSLRTLVDRGLDWSKYLTPSNMGSDEVAQTKDIRARIAEDLKDDCHNGHFWEVGLFLGLFARKFGARAPLTWIARQLFFDCVRVTREEDDEDDEWFGNGVDFGSEVEEGINEALFEWWLADLNFFNDVREFETWRDEMEYDMGWDWVDFGETWQRDAPSACEGSLRKSSSYSAAYQGIKAKHDDMREEIEARAISIGL